MGWVNDLIEAVLKFFGLKGAKPAPVPVVPSPQPTPVSFPSPTVTTPSPIPTPVVIPHDTNYFLKMIYENFLPVANGIQRFNIVSKEFETWVPIHGYAIAAEQFRLQLLNKSEEEAIKLIHKALDDAVTSDDRGITVSWISQNPYEAFRALTGADRGWFINTLNKYKITEKEVKEFLKSLI